MKAAGAFDENGRKNIVFSYGNDPIIILPAIKESNAAIGDHIEVTIKLKETGIQQFLNDFQEEPTVKTATGFIDARKGMEWLKQILLKH